MTEAQEIAKQLFDRYVAFGGSPEHFRSMGNARIQVKLLGGDLGPVQTDNVAEALVALAKGEPLDSAVRAIQKRYAERAAFGLEKYGVTTDRKDLSTFDWITHLQEELMDAVIYIEKVREAWEP